MDINEERRAIGAVIVRLADRFPDAGHEQVEQAVRAEYEALSDHPVRAYIPVLVERAAKERLQGHPSRT